MFCLPTFVLFIILQPFFMKNCSTFFDLRSSLRVSLQMLVGLIISLCCVNQGNAQDGVAWTSTNQLDPNNENYYVCTSAAPIIFYIYPDEYCNVYDCSGNTQTTTLNNLLGYLNGTAITPMPYPTGGWYAWTYSLDPSTLTSGATYEISFYPDYQDGDCGWPTTTGTPSITYIHILTPNDVPSVTIGSSTYLCPNTNITFTRDSNPYLSGNSPSFIWQKNGIDIVGQTGQTYTTNTLVAGDVITCEMTSSNTCLNTPTVDSNPLTITNPLTPSLSISSNPATSASICPNTNITFTANAINAGSNPRYYWYKNGVSLFIGSNNIYSNTFTCPSNWLQPNDVITCIMNTGNTCVTTSVVTSSTNSLTFTNIQPKAQITFPTGVSSVCMNGSAQLSVNNVNGTSTYIWQVLSNNAWSTIAGATASSYTTPPLTTTTSYRYIRDNSLCGLDTSYKADVSVSGSISALYLAASSICAGGTVNVNLTGGNTGATYTWQVSTNGGTTWTNITGYVNTTNTSFSNIPGSNRIYQVIVNDAVCGVYITPSVALTLVADPLLTVTPSNNNFCAGGNTTLTTSVTGGLGTNSYQWQQYISNVWTNIAGATGASYTASNLSATTNYRANLTQSVSGCAASVISPITVKALPNITTNPTSANIVNGNSISLNAYNGTSYSWSPATGLNTTTGATVIASPSISTTYTVTGTDVNGCSKAISLPITVSYSTGIAENTITDVSIFPNPADKNIRISMNTPFSKSISFCISDIFGKTLTQWEGKAENGVYENEISIENLSQGVYFLSVKIGERVMTQKFVKE